MQVSFKTSLPTRGPKLVNASLGTNKKTLLKHHLRIWSIKRARASGQCRAM
jgi:hypothetical protein